MIDYELYMWQIYEIPFLKKAFHFLYSCSGKSTLIFMFSYSCGTFEREGFSLLPESKYAKGKRFIEEQFFIYMECKKIADSLIIFRLHWVWGNGFL